MVNKSVLLLSGFIFGLTCGLDAQAGQRSKTERQCFTMDDYITKTPRTAGKARLRASQERVKPIARVQREYLVPGNDFRNVNPNSKGLSSLAKAWLRKKHG